MPSAHIVARGKKGKNGKRSGPYSVVIEYGFEDGHRKQKWLSGYRTKTEAETARDDTLRELRTGQYIDPTNLSTGTWLDKWLERDCVHLKPKTFDSYASIVPELKEHLGDIPLQKLSTERIQDMVTYWHETGSKLTKRASRPLGFLTIQTRIRCLNVALNRAVELEMLAKNRAKTVIIPRDAEEDGEYSVLSVKEVERLIEAAKTTDIYMPVLIAVMTGLTRAEILGLRWSDFNSEQSSLTVRRNAVKPKGHAVVFDSTKTKSRRRAVGLPSFLVTELQAHRRRQSAQRLQMGGMWQDEDLICTDDLGGPVNPEWLSNAFHHFCEKHGFKVTFHGLRHTQATLLISQGVSAKAVQARLGHSKVGMTMDVYTSVTPEMQEQTVTALEAAFGGSR